MVRNELQTNEALTIQTIRRSIILFDLGMKQTSFGNIV